MSQLSTLLPATASNPVAGLPRGRGADSAGMDATGASHGAAAYIGAELQKKVDEAVYALRRATEIIDENRDRLVIDDVARHVSRIDEARAGFRLNGLRSRLDVVG